VRRDWDYWLNIAAMVGSSIALVALTVDVVVWMLS
jgi:hypothetical protein